MFSRGFPQAREVIPGPYESGLRGEAPMQLDELGRPGCVLVDRPGLLLRLPQPLRQRGGDKVGAPASGGTCGGRGHAPQALGCLPGPLPCYAAWAGSSRRPERKAPADGQHRCPAGTEGRRRLRYAPDGGIPSSRAKATLSRRCRDSGSPRQTNGHRGAGGRRLAATSESLLKSSCLPPDISVEPTRQGPQQGSPVMCESVSCSSGPLALPMGSCWGGLTA